MRSTHLLIVIIAAILGGVVTNLDRVGEAAARCAENSEASPWQPIEQGTATTIVEKIHAEVFEMTKGFAGREAVLAAIQREEIVQEIRRENLTVFAVDFVEDGYGDDAFARVQFRIRYEEGVAHAYKWQETQRGEVRELLPPRGHVDLFWQVKQVPAWAEPYRREVADGAGNVELGSLVQKGRASVELTMQSLALLDY